jgi:hypothetical protein
MDMGVCKIVKQMGKSNLENRAKIITPKKWLIAMSNCRHYGLTRPQTPW